MRKLAIIFLALLVACSGQQKKEDETKKSEAMPKQKQEAAKEYALTKDGNPIVTFKTTMGDFDVEVFADSCPIHGANFLRLVDGEVYDDNIFHRVIPDFMIQTGDPTGTGRGDPGYWLEQEAKPFKYKNLRSYIAMAQTGDGRINGSQFYILVKDSPHLDNKFPCFARVISGMDVVDKISKVKTDKNDRPVEDVRIISARRKLKSAESEGNTETTGAH
jgi:cyclophilin family peptidyl-prolyl cis-trans isomerase